MPRYTLKVNGRERVVDADADMPLLWVLRDTLGLTGTKFGCGMSLCGACTVHLDGEAVRACVTPVPGAARGARHDGRTGRPMIPLVKVSRRDFLRVVPAAGAGLVIGLRLDARDAAAAESAAAAGAGAATKASATSAPFSPNAWIQIAPDGG